MRNTSYYGNGGLTATLDLPALLTANSSSHAVSNYRKMGFMEAGHSGEFTGIIFVPMVCALDEPLPSLPTSP